MEAVLKAKAAMQDMQMKAAGSQQQLQTTAMSDRQKLIQQHLAGQQQLRLKEQQAKTAAAKPKEGNK
jgi:hypothetical protein